MAEALEIEEDLNMILGELDSQAFAAVDMQGFVLIAIDGEGNSRGAASQSSTRRRRIPRWARP